MIFGDDEIKVNPVAASMKEEFTREVEKTLEADSERATSDKVAPKAVLVPAKVVDMVVRCENALILSALTKNDSAAIKQAASEGIAPSESDAQAVADFMNVLIDRYAPSAFADPLQAAAAVWAMNFAGKIAVVQQIRMSMK